MEKYGFTVETFNCCDSTKPANTVVATWGSGHPVIGFIGEYDALPGIGQEVKPYPSPKEGNGQGCGHEIGLKAAVHAGMVLAQCAYDIVKDPSVIKAWRADLDAQLAKEGDIKPIFPQRKDITE